MKILEKIVNYLRPLPQDIYSIHTHLTVKERKLLFSLARSLPENPVIVEIGSYLGASACFLAAGARFNQGKVFAVDTWTNIGMPEGEKDTFEDFIKNIRNFKNIYPLRGHSKDIAQSFHEDIDFLFIDGGHSYEEVSMDLSAWLPKVKERGIVYFHDFSWAEGVRQAVKEYVAPIQIEEGQYCDLSYWTRIRKL